MYHMKRDTLDQCRTRGWRALEQVWVSSLEGIRMGVWDEGSWVWEHAFMCFGKNLDGLQGSSCTSLGTWWIVSLYCEFHTNVKHGRSFRSEQVQHDTAAGRFPALEFRSTKWISLNSVQLSIKKMVSTLWVAKATTWGSAEEALNHKVHTVGVW